MAELLGTSPGKGGNPFSLARVPVRTGGGALNHPTGVMHRDQEEVTLLHRPSVSRRDPWPSILRTKDSGVFFSLPADIPESLLSWTVSIQSFWVQ